mmetsp:Transcript_34863/g.98834  ORF Transcript_34863/g.98834 Transcript_34863/m.98834 type:complete len:404 (-) Transcript_34863:2826-4037(-)
MLVAGEFPIWSLCSVCRRQESCKQRLQRGQEIFHLVEQLRPPVIESRVEQNALSGLLGAAGCSRALRVGGAWLAAAAAAAGSCRRAGLLARGAAAGLAAAPASLALLLWAPRLWAVLGLQVWATLVLNFPLNISAKLLHSGQQGRHPLRVDFDPDKAGSSLGRWHIGKKCRSLGRFPYVRCACGLSWGRFLRPIGAAGVEVALVGGQLQAHNPAGLRQGLQHVVQLAIHLEDGSHPAHLGHCLCVAAAHGAARPKRGGLLEDLLLPKQDAFNVGRLAGLQVQRLHVRRCREGLRKHNGRHCGTGVDGVPAAVGQLQGGPLREVPAALEPRCLNGIPQCGHCLLPELLRQLRQGDRIGPQVERVAFRFAGGFLCPSSSIEARLARSGQCSCCSCLRPCWAPCIV